MTQKIPVLFLFLPLVFVIIGGALSFKSLRGHVEAFTVYSWSTASGRILESSIEAKAERGFSYEVKVTYDYTVDGVTHTGTRIHPTYVADWHRDSHEELLERLRPDSAVRVYYRPKDPSRSYLATGIVAAGFIPLVGGLIFFGAGLAFGTTMLLINYGGHDYASLISSP